MSSSLSSISQKRVNSLPMVPLPQQVPLPLGVLQPGQLGSLLEAVSTFSEFKIEQPFQWRCQFDIGRFAIESQTRFYERKAPLRDFNLFGPTLEQALKQERRVMPKIQFFGSLEGNLKPEEVKKILIDALIATIGLRSYIGPNSTMYVNPINECMVEISHRESPASTHLFEMPGRPLLKDLSINDRSVGMEVPLSIGGIPRSFRIEVDLGDEIHRSVTSNESLACNLLPYFYNSKNIPRLKTMKGYELAETLDLRSKGHFKVDLAQDPLIKDAVSLYALSLIEQGRLPLNHEGEALYVKSWEKEWEKSGTEPYLNHLEQFIKSNLSSAPAAFVYLNTLRSLFASHPIKESEKFLALFDRKSSEILAQFYPNGPKFDLPLLRALTFWNLVKKTPFDVEEDFLRRYSFSSSGLKTFVTAPWEETLTLLSLPDSELNEKLALMAPLAEQGLRLSLDSSGKKQFLIPCFKNLLPDPRAALSMLLASKTTQIAEFIPSLVGALPYFNRSHLGMVQKSIQIHHPELGETLPRIIGEIADFSNPLGFVEAALKHDLSLAQTTFRTVCSHTKTEAGIQKVLSFALDHVELIDPKIAEWIERQFSEHPSRFASNEKSWFGHLSQTSYLSVEQFSSLLKNPLLQKKEKPDFVQKVMERMYEKGDYTSFFACWNIACKERCLPPPLISSLLSFLETQKERPEYGPICIEAVRGLLELGIPPQSFFQKIPPHWFENQATTQKCWNLLQETTGRKSSGISGNEADLLRSLLSPSIDSKLFLRSLARMKGGPEAREDLMAFGKLLHGNGLPPLDLKAPLSTLFIPFLKDEVWNPHLISLLLGPDPFPAREQIIQGISPHLSAHEVSLFLEQLPFTQKETANLLQIDLSPDQPSGNTPPAWLENQQIAQRCWTLLQQATGRPVVSYEKGNEGALLKSILKPSVDHRAVLQWMVERADQPELLKDVMAFGRYFHEDLFFDFDPNSLSLFVFLMKNEEWAPHLISLLSHSPLFPHRERVLKELFPSLSLDHFSPLVQSPFLSREQKQDLTEKMMERLFKNKQITPFLACWKIASEGNCLPRKSIQLLVEFMGEKTNTPEHAAGCIGALLGLSQLGESPERFFTNIPPSWLENPAIVESCWTLLQQKTGRPHNVGLIGPQEANFLKTILQSPFNPKEILRSVATVALNSPPESRSERLKDLLSFGKLFHKESFLDFNPDSDIRDLFFPLLKSREWTKSLIDALTDSAPFPAQGEILQKIAPQLDVNLLTHESLHKLLSEKVTLPPAVYQQIFKTALDLKSYRTLLIQNFSSLLQRLPDWNQEIREKLIPLLQSSAKWELPTLLLIGKKGWPGRELWEAAVRTNPVRSTNLSQFIELSHLSHPFINTDLFWETLINKEPSLFSSNLPQLLEMSDLPGPLHDFVTKTALEKKDTRVVKFLSKNFKALEKLPFDKFWSNLTSLQHPKFSSVKNEVDQLMAAGYERMKRNRNPEETLKALLQLDPIPPDLFFASLELLPLSKSWPFLISLEKEKMENQRELLAKFVHQKIEANKNPEENMRLLFQIEEIPEDLFLSNLKQLEQEPTEKLWSIVKEIFTTQLNQFRWKLRPVVTQLMLQKISQDKPEQALPMLGELLKTIKPRGATRDCFKVFENILSKNNRLYQEKTAREIHEKLVSDFGYWTFENPNQKEMRLGQLGYHSLEFLKAGQLVNRQALLTIPAELGKIQKEKEGINFFFDCLTSLIKNPSSPEKSPALSLYWTELWKGLKGNEILLNIAVIPPLVKYHEIASKDILTPKDNALCFMVIQEIINQTFERVLKAQQTASISPLRNTELENVPPLVTRLVGSFHDWMMNYHSSLPPLPPASKENPFHSEEEEQRFIEKLTNHLKMIDLISKIDPTNRSYHIKWILQIFDLAIEKSPKPGGFWLGIEYPIGFVNSFAVFPDYQKDLVALLDKVNQFINLHQKMSPDEKNALSKSWAKSAMANSKLWN